MSKKATKEEFIKKATNIHGNKYDYSKVEYVNYNTRVCIICPEHGEFWQTPTKHLQGRGCEKCGCLKRDKKSRKSLADFVEKAKLVHNDKYDYSKVEYSNNHTKVCITCPEHGDFWQTPKAHLSGRGCPKCKHSGRKYTLHEFIEASNKKHNNKYDYSKVAYIDSKTKVCIICPEHGEFWQAPAEHLYGYGCYKCARENSYLTTDEFIYKANKIHNGKYDYSNVKYEKWLKKIPIICPKHGEFWQTPCKHLKGQGCPKCKSSHLELFTMNVLNEMGVKFKHQANKDDLDWLGRQKLDFFLPDHNVAIECQGEQHFGCVELWGGKNGLEKRIKLDKDKLKKCTEHGVTVYYIGEESYANKYGLLTITELKNKIKNGL